MKKKIQQKPNRYLMRKFTESSVLNLAKVYREVWKRFGRKFYKSLVENSVGYLTRAQQENL